MVDLKFDRLFESLKSQSYCVIKLSPDFPRYTKGDDLDLFCRDVVSCSRLILEFLQEYLGGPYSVRVARSAANVKIDLMHDRDIEFRFDLIGDQPVYKNILVKPSFFDIVIERSTTSTDLPFNVSVPVVEDDLILRYIEYIEYFSQRPDKIKHTDYINDMIEKCICDQDRFHNRLYYYTSIPSPVYTSKNIFDKIRERVKLIATLFHKAKHLYKEKGLLSVFKKVLQRLK